jgi:hypothetical protein
MVENGVDLNTESGVERLYHLDISTTQECLIGVMFAIVVG